MDIVNRHTGLIILSIDDATLHGADLRSADLQGANLQSADLQNANLRSADLQNANLHGADLRSADLQGANLHGANLQPGLFIKGDCPFIQIGPIGSRLDYLSAFMTNKGIFLRTGCFFGSIKDFNEAVITRYGGSQIRCSLSRSDQSY